MTTVVIVDVAEAQLLEIAAWWTANRHAAPDLVIEELERCVTLLESTPDAGMPFHRASVPGVRRLVMRKTRHFIYYIHDAARAAVYIIAVWGTAKGSDPVLRDPR